MKTKTKGILFVTVFIVALVIVFIKPISIKYHLLMADYSWDKTVEYGPDDNRQSKYILKSCKHRDALVKLSYYEHKIIPLKHIEYPSRESKALWKELGSAVLTNFSMMEGYWPDVPDEIILYDLPENISELEQIIATHDNIPTTKIILDNNVAPETILPFVGQWGTKEDGVVFTITNSFQFEEEVSPPWETVTKNIQFDGKKLSFDSFCYIEKSEDLKTITNPSGEHSFSGVRVHNELMLNQDNPNELINTGSTHLTEPLKGSFFKIQ